MILSTLNFSDIEEFEGKTTKVFFTKTANLPAILDLGLILEAQVPETVHIPQDDEDSTLMLFSPKSIGDWHDYVVVERRVRIVAKETNVQPPEMQMVATYTLEVVVRKGT